MHHRAIDELRHTNRYIGFTEGDPDTGRFGPNGRWAEPPTPWGKGLDDQVHARRVLEAVQRELDRLPHAHRQILLPRDSEDLSNADIAEVLGISVGNTRIRLHRARKALRAAVADELE